MINCFLCHKLVKNHFLMIWIGSALAIIVLCLPNHVIFLKKKNLHCLPPFPFEVNLGEDALRLRRRPMLPGARVPLADPSGVSWCWQWGMKTRKSMVICSLKGSKGNGLWLVTTNITRSPKSRSAVFCFGVPQWTRAWYIDLCKLQSVQFWLTKHILGNLSCFLWAKQIDRKN